MVGRARPQPLPATPDFAGMLGGGDRRSIGRADDAVAILLVSPSGFGVLWACLRHQDPLVRMRAADALEKFSRVHPAAFEAHRAELLSGALEDGTPEMRWNLIPIIARLTLRVEEAERVMDRLSEWVRHDRSRIAKVMALQAACDIAARLPAVRNRAGSLLAFAAGSPWASVRARARKLGMERR